MNDENVLKLEFTVAVEIPMTEKQIEYAKSMDRFDYESEYAENFRECLEFNDNVKIVDYWCEADMPVGFFKEND